MLTRRQFLNLCMTSAVGVSLSELLVPVMRDVLAQGKVSRPPVIWLELGSCTGNTISLYNAVNPSMMQFLTETIELRYHWTINTATGDQRPSDVFRDVSRTTQRQTSFRHWFSYTEGTADHYQIVPPTTWNLSPRDAGSGRGPLEEALIGTPVADAESLIEVGRVIRSFDPCLTCAVHLLKAPEVKPIHV